MDEFGYETYLKAREEDVIKKTRTPVDIIDDMIIDTSFDNDFYTDHYFDEF